MERDSVSDDASSSSDCSVKIPAPLTEEELFSRRLFQLVSNYSFKISLSSERKALALFICRALIKHLPRPSSTDEIDQISKYVGFFSIFIGCFENDLSIRNRISEFQHVINVPGNGDGEIENSSLGGAPTSLMNLIGTMSIELMEFMEKVLIPMSPRVEYALSPATRNDIQALIDAHTQSSIIWKKYVDMFDSKVLPHLKTGEGDHLKLQTDLLGLGWMLLILAKSYLFTSLFSTEYDVYIILLCIIRFLVQAVTPNLTENLDFTSFVHLSTSSKKDLKEKHILSSCEKFQITIFLPFISEIFRKVFDKYFEASEGIIHDGNVETQTSDACLDEIAYMNMTAIIYNGVHSGISLRSKKLQPLSLNSQASFSSSYLEGEPRKILAELINNVSNFVDTCPYDAAKNLRNSNLWIDERIYLKMYLQQKENAIARRDLSNTPDTEQCIQTVNVNMNPAFSPILHSPSRAKQSYHNSPLRSPSTPISIVFEAVSWLSSTVVNLPSELTEDFKAELSDISQEISVSVLRTIDDVIPIAFSQLGSISSEIWKFRKELGLKLFFKLLEKVFRKELENKNYSPIGVSRLLTNVEFQRALLAISYEIMATSYKVPRFCFPKILESFNLSSFEFNKVIEVVFSCEKGMPRSIRHHLQDIEQKIVLYFAWQPNDKMIGFLCKHKEFLSDLKVTFEEEEQCKFRRLEDVAVRSPPSKNKGQKFAVELLYRNLLKISSDRLEELSYDTSLGITPPLIDVIWILLKSIIFDHFHLMFGRHFDSILLCSIYAVNRLAKRNSPVTFKSIISSYLNRYPTNYDLVITRIYLENSSPKHIIEFYNSTFISTLKSFITEKLTKILSKRLAAGFANSSLSSPRKLGVRPTPLNAGLVTPPSFRNPLTSPGKSPLNISNSSNWVPNSSPITKRPMPKVTIDGVANIYVSPKKRFRAQGFRTPGSSVSTNLQNSSQNSSENSNKSSSAPAMTPRTGLLYAFGESPARLLHMHNSRVHQDLGRLGNMNPHKSPHGPLAANSKSSLDPVGRQRILSLPSRSSEEMPALSSTYSCSDSDDGTESVTNQSA